MSTQFKSVMTSRSCLASLGLIFLLTGCASPSTERDNRTELPVEERVERVSTEVFETEEEFEAAVEELRNQRRMDARISRFWDDVVFHVPRNNHSEPFQWILAAAQEDDYRAQRLVGLMHELGEGVPQDNVEALRWFRKVQIAAEQGDPDAQYTFGIMHDRGDGVPQDRTEAANWLRKASEQGHATAQFDLGTRYRDGVGVPQNGPEAIKWFRPAAEQGDTMVQLHIASMYEEGQGVPQSYAEALRWIRRAADQRDASAQWRLGYMYEVGRGVPQSYLEAYIWYNVSAANGDRTAPICRNRVARQMSHDEIALGQRRAVALAAGHGGSPPLTESEPGSPPPTFGGSLLGTGTGFFITDDGHFLCNFHVVAEGDRVIAQTHEGVLEAVVLKTDPANDLALLKVPSKSSGLPITSSRSVRLGNTVATVGFPNIGLQGFAPKLAKGEIAGLTGARDDPRYFQISAPLQPGNSGGALVNDLGNVVGIVAAKLDLVAAVRTSGALPENVNYAIKSSYLLSFLESVPGLIERLKEPNTKVLRIEEVAQIAEQAAILVLVY